MRKKLVILACGLFLSVQAQFNSDAPWMEDLAKAKRTSRGAKSDAYTFKEIVNAFDSYWENKNPDVKGSGYKPFMRWKHYWENAQLPDGKLPSTEFMIQEWNKKNRMAQPSTANRANLWTSMGPYDHNQSRSWSPGQGRVNFAIADPNNPSTLYVGTPAGGIWKSTDRGNNWTPLTDHLPQIGVSGIAIDPKNSNIIYIATGDDDASDSYSTGVWKSTNAGKTWNRTGLRFNSTQALCNEIYIDPSNSKRIWVASNAGLYKTNDAGNKWDKVLNGNIKDFKLKPGDANTIYAVTRSDFYKSTDGGSNFRKVSNGLPYSSGRLVIDVTPAAPKYVYVLSADSRKSFQGIYLSTNSGDSFSRRSESQNIFESSQAWYDLALAVSDKDANTLFVGCLNVWKSSNGGNSFRKINNWSSPRQSTYTHADIHFLRYYKGNLFCGSDGGFYISNNDGRSFYSKTKGLQISQFYKISVAENHSSNKIVGGLQDNGGYAHDGKEWHNYYGADGMDCAVSKANSDTYYGFIQSGRILYRTTRRGQNMQQVAKGPEQGNWVTPLVSDSKGSLYAGYTNLYKYSGGNGFRKVSNYNFGGRIDEIEIDPSNDDIIYLSNEEALYRSSDAGRSWKRVHRFDTKISSIEVNNDDNKIVYVTTRGSSNGGVYKSYNYGSKFENITGNLPREGKFVVRHQRGSDNIYLGTYLGVYTKTGNNEWVNYSGNLPNTAVRDLEVNLHDKVIVAATYGRGIWKAPLTNSKISKDKEAPTTPSNLSAYNVKANSLSLKWNASKDNVGVSGYQVYSKENRLIAEVRSNSTTITKLSAETTYSFKVRAVDLAKNLSKFSKTITVTTKKGKDSDGDDDDDNDGVDTQAPTAPSNLRAYKLGYNSFKIVWNASRDNVGVAQYGIFIDGRLIGTTRYTQQELSGASEGVNYKIAIKAQDAAGNTSEFSNEIIVNLSEDDDVDDCLTAKPYNYNKRYRIGDKVLSRGYLYVKTRRGWKRLKYCGRRGYETSKKLNVLVLSLDDDTNKGVNSEPTIAPNPATNYIDVIFDADKNSTFKIVDVTGRTVKKGAFSHKIDTSDLKENVYFIKITSGNKVFTKVFYIK